MGERRGWLLVDGCHVDLILRDINRVAEEIAACSEGRVTTNYQTGHPHGFLNVMYMGEVAVCQILHDHEGRIAELKAKTKPYPAPLKDALVGYFYLKLSFQICSCRRALTR